MGRTKSGKSGKRKPRGWWVIAILDEIEETGFVLVHWGGINPMTGKPWHDSWIPRENFKGSGEKMLRKWDKYKAREKDRLRREWPFRFEPAKRGGAIRLNPRASSLPLSPVGQCVMIDDNNMVLSAPPAFGEQVPDSREATPSLASDHSDVEGGLSYADPSGVTVQNVHDNSSVDSLMAPHEYANLHVMEPSELDITTELDNRELAGDNAPFVDSSTFDSFLATLDRVNEGNVFGKPAHPSASPEAPTGRLYREVIMRQCPFDKQPEDLLMPIMKSSYPLFTSLRYLEGMPDDFVPAAFATFPVLWQFQRFTDLTPPSAHSLSNLPDLKDALHDRNQAWTYICKITEELRTILQADMVVNKLNQFEINDVRIAVDALQQRADMLREQLCTLQQHLKRFQF